MSTDYRIGDRASFAGMDWLVVADTGKGLLLITDDRVARRAFHSQNPPANWLDCELRVWLNNEWLNTLPEDAREALLPGPDGDLVSLLSVEEASDLLDQVRARKFWWWLRSPGSSSQFNQAVVDYDGWIDRLGACKNHGYGSVRPTVIVDRGILSLTTT